MGDSRKQEMQTIYDLEKIGEYEAADKRFKKLLKKHPADYKLMWQYVLYLTNNLQEDGIEFFFDEEIVLRAQDYAHKAVKLAPEKYADEIIERWEVFVNKYNRRLEKERERSEKKRQLNIYQVIHGDYEQLDGIYFGYTADMGSRFLCENHKLYMYVKIRNKTYVSQENLGEKLPEKKIEVSFDENGFFEEHYDTGLPWWKEWKKRPLLLNGKKVQLHEIKRYDIGGKQSVTCVFMMDGDKVFLHQ